MQVGLRAFIRREAYSYVGNPLTWGDIRDKAMKVNLYHNPFTYILSVTLTPSLLHPLLQHVLQASYLHCLLPHVMPLSHDERLVKRDYRTGCKYPEILCLVRNQQRYGRAAYTTAPATERDTKSGKEVYSSVYSSIAPLILYDGHTTYVNIVFAELS